MVFLNKIRVIFWKIKVIIISFIKKNEVNKKLGISRAEFKKISKIKEHKIGKVKLFNNDFYFSNIGGFLHSHREIFEEEVYKFHTDKENPLIIDCGSNYGLSVLYFKLKYPNSKIIAFEPDKKIFELLKKNLQNYHSIELHNEAVWTEDKILSFHSEGSLAGRITDNPEEVNSTVKAVDLKKYLNQKIDFLKIDIEGAENTVIFDIKDYLSNVDNLFLEYHGMPHEKQNLGDILNLLSGAGFHYYIRVAGECMKDPFLDKIPKMFTLQLNIFCKRIK